MAAEELARAGLSVTVLEAGRAFDPAEHTPDETTADLYWMEERLSGGRDPIAFGANNSGQGVGGSLLDDFIYIDIHDHETSEYRLLSTKDLMAEPVLVAEREEGVALQLSR